MKKHPEKKTGKGYFRFKKFVAIFSVYYLVFIAVFAWIDYYSEEVYNPLPFLILGFIIATVASAIHLRHGGKSRVDDLAKKL